MEGGALDKACNELQALVSGLKPPKQLSKEVGESDNAHRLITCCQSSCYSVLDLLVCTRHVSTALVLYCQSYKCSLLWCICSLWRQVTMHGTINTSCLQLLAVGWTDIPCFSFMHHEC